MFNLLKDKTIIICENNNKISILKEITNSFLDIKFYTKKEFFEEYLFKYDEKAICYLIDKYNYKIEIAKMYLDNLKYIDENIIYKSSKLNYLVKLKKELDDNNLIIYNKEFNKEIDDYKILVINYPYLEKHELNIFNKLNAEIINNKGGNKLDKVYVFNTEEEEINFVCKKICKLILNGISINKIKIMGINDNYYNNLYRLFKLYKLPIKIPTNNTLISNNITKIFIDNLIKGLDYSIDSIKNENEYIVNNIINICNKYVYITNNNIKNDLIINDLKSTNIDNFNLKNYIDIISINSIVNDDEYIFYLNFNNGSFPNIINDEKYITDNIKDEVNLKKTSEINKEIKEYEINKLKSIKNLIISCKLSDSNGECYPSSLIKELNMKEIYEENDILNSNSYNYDLINLCRCEDNYNKYGVVTEEYLIYKNNIKEKLYNSFDNKYTKIKKNDLLEYLNNKLILSYSSLSNYYKCSFRYYLSNILKLDKYEDTFEAFIGSIFHDVLEHSINNNVNVQDEIKRYIEKSGKTLSIKERFFINKIIDDINFVINILNKQKNYTSFNNCLFEQNIEIDKSKDILIKFVGYIDKILYKKDDNKTLISIIDYKTGNVDININYVPFGINIQLPIYLYLVSKSNLFINPEFVGFYVQYILEKDIVKDNEKSYYEQYENNLKLVGYSNFNIHSLVEFDNTFENSELIKSMKVKNDGNFSVYSKVLDNKKIDILINTTEKIIDDAINNILDANFDINPKKIGYDKVVGCAYCKFKDICFKTEKDYVIIPESKDLNYLKVGEKYAKMD